tara:strand:+ start:8058 stop:8795 length:738 start_codon:yes stop_codon:yes gene_type:complete
MSDFKNKVALITGASSGIGAETAKRLATKGARVFCAQRTKSLHEDILIDLKDINAPKKIISEIVNKAGKIDILINNAGIMKENTVEEILLEEWNDHITINLTAPFLLIKYAMPLLKKNNGSIVNVGSIEGLSNNPRHPAYSASKAGLHGLTRAIAIDHGLDGIRCNAVAPGWINTKLNQDFIKSLDNEKKFKKKLESIHPLGRSGEVKEVANLICWLVSEEASFVTGQVWVIDGGRMTKLSLPDN